MQSAVALDARLWLGLLGGLLTAALMMAQTLLRWPLRRRTNPALLLAFATLAEASSGGLSHGQKGGWSRLNPSTFH